MGNDRHRDGKTVIGAFGGSSEYEVTIFSTTASPRLAEGSDNIEIRGLKNNEELQDALMRSSLLVLPLKENLHASGATVVQQAVAAGLPVVASNTGGLHAYFAEDEIEYVEPQSPQALRTAVDRVLNSPDNAIEKARRAQLRMTSGEIGVDAYIRDHVRISQEMLER
ncbi:MAG: glycosyltransferase [Pseudomonadota bacterium]